MAREAEPRASTDVEDAPLLQRDEETPDEANAFPQFLHRKGSLSTLEQLLLGISLALLILAGIFIGLFAGQKHINDTRPSRPIQTVTATHDLPTSTSTVSEPVPTRSPSKNDEICLSPTCVTDAADLLNGLDTSVDPCDDFYGFANNGWLEMNPVPEDKALFGAAQAIDQSNKRLISTILNSAIPKSYNEADQTNLQHLKAFYGACMNEDHLDRLGLEPLLEVLRPVMHAWRGKEADEERGLKMQVKSPWDWIPIPRPQPTSLPDQPKPKRPKGSIPRRERLTDTLLFLHSRGVPAIWENDAAGDVGDDPSLLRIWISQAELGLPDRDYYKDEDTLVVYQEVVRSSLVNLYKSLDEDVPDVVSSERSSKPLEELASDVVAFEKELARVSWNVGDSEDPTLTYNPSSLKNFTELTGDMVNLHDYFSGFSPRPGFPDPLIVGTPSYFGNLTSIMQKTSDETLEAYFVWRTALNFGLLLGPGETVRKEVTRLNDFIGGVDEGVRPRREDSCLQSVQDNLGFLIGRYYVMSAFSGDSKAYAEEIIEAVVDAFYKRLPQLDWLDPETRRYAQEKAEAIKHKIGFPTSPNTTDPTSLLNYYSAHAPFDKKGHFGNVLRANLASQRRMWNKVNRLRDDGEWEMIPSEVNAYYSPEANEIAFPAGILQPPYFKVSMPEYLAFGSFGCVSGHELSHAFDKSGRLFNKHGKLTNWWTNETTIEFNKRQKCIEDQYAQYYVEDAQGKKYYINSKQTGGEDLADAGGISQAFDAWKRRFEGDADGQKYDNYLLPGLNYTREQLFFIGYARGWVRGLKPEEAVRRIRTDVHSPTNFRVLGPLSNEQEFAKAFNCPLGSRYNPEKKCHVW